MPLYEYQCRACSHRFERIQKFSDPPVAVCPQCGKSAVDQLLSAPAVQFKGSGWYVTDYARKATSTTAPAKTETSASPSSPEKSGGNGAGSTEKPSSSSASSNSGSSGAAPSSTGGTSSGSK